jgi:hypothetical protein
MSKILEEGKVIGIHIYTDENFKLWKRWEDSYQNAYEYEWQSEQQHNH